MSSKKFSDLPATSSHTLGSSPVMVICDRRAGWSGLFQSSWTIVMVGLALDLEALGSWRQNAAQCPSWWHLWQAILRDYSWFGHSLARCPACLQIRHLSRALSFKDLEFAIGLFWKAASIWACVVSFSLPLLGLGLFLLFSVIRGIGGCLDHLI